MKWKWRNDRRSERNLCNCVKKPEKKGPEKKGPPGGYFLVRAAGWGRIFTTGLTFKELHFYKSY